MVDPQYDTVKGFITEGSHIVEAVPTDNPAAALTGLTVWLWPSEWRYLDKLEYGYDRVLVKTTNGALVSMYVKKGSYGSENSSNS